MTTKANMNGQARKSLADQIDRLDAMLDGLSEGLNEAVATAVQEAVGAAVQHAVQAVLREVLTNPEMLARLGGAALPVAAPASAASAARSPKTSWKQRRALVCKSVTALQTAARQEGGRRVRQARAWTAGAWMQVRLLGRIKYQLLIALSVGAYCAGPWLAATAGGVAGFCTTLAVQAGMALKRLWTQAATSVV
jgi:AcrR family transcriptional regulator